MPWVWSVVLAVQLDLPGTPFNRARKARDYILAAIKERVAEKKLEFERGSVKKDTLLAFYASAKADEGDPLDEHELAVSHCTPRLSDCPATADMRELFQHFFLLSAYEKQACEPCIKPDRKQGARLPADAAVAAADERPPADAGRQRHVPGRAQGAAGRSARAAARHHGRGGCSPPALPCPASCVPAVAGSKRLRGMLTRARCCCSCCSCRQASCRW